MSRRLNTVVRDLAEQVVDIWVSVRREGVPVADLGFGFSNPEFCQAAVITEEDQQYIKAHIKTASKQYACTSGVSEDHGQCQSSKEHC